MILWWLALWGHQAQAQPQVYPCAGERQCAAHSDEVNDTGALDTLLAALRPDPQIWSESVAAAPDSVGRLEPIVPVVKKTVEMPHMPVTKDKEGRVVIQCQNPAISPVIVLARRVRTCPCSMSR